MIERQARNWRQMFSRLLGQLFNSVRKRAPHFDHGEIRCASLLLEHPLPPKKAYIQAAACVHEI